MILRLALVLGLYLTGALLLDRLSAALVPVLVLPPVFMTLVRVFLSAGLVIALVLAWRYRPAQE